ncbi:maleylpyruvate isomerase N-terminal domain-containing protein [Amycolatopsis sp. NPDC059021]|uniref:maleylpyruvate isomerase N-terminal domain-containing protein n=1 Tax=Amycolatopsis sp. NPDC059021 TaxID=3346704 RepID=UPI003670F4F5
MDTIAARFLLSSNDFERRLRDVRQGQWTWPTPCTEWNVRVLVNHMTRGNLNYVHLAGGGSSAEFLRLRDADALGDDPVGAYIRSVEQRAEAFARPGVLDRLLDYPLGKLPGRQALAVRTKARRRARPRIASSPPPTKHRARRGKSGYSG